ncbi:unnamed protein product, partial [Dicrocoelium dendriticum]
MRPRCTNRQLPARDRYLRAKTCLGQIDQRDCPVEVTENEILTPKNVNHYHIPVIYNLPKL